MIPTLFELNLGFTSIPIHTYGFMIAIGFLLAVFTVRKLAARNGINPDLVSDLSFWLLVYGFIGARILYVITRYQDFVSDPLSVIRVWEGGLVFFGGLISATVYSIYFFRRHRLSPWKMIDILSPGVVLAHAFGRLGCLGAGCCYGKHTDLPWGIKLNSELLDSGFRGVPLHPVQLYESVSLFILFAGMIHLSRKKKFEGQIGLTYFILYPIIRSLVEIFRGDIVRGFVIQDILSTSQFISFLIFLSATLILLKRLKKVSLYGKR